MIEWILKYRILVIFLIIGLVAYGYYSFKTIQLTHFQTYSNTG